MAIADAQENVLGGHVTEGFIVYTTDGIITGETEALISTHRLDDAIGYLGLEIQHC